MTSIPYIDYKEGLGLIRTLLKRTLIHFLRAQLVKVYFSIQEYRLVKHTEMYEYIGMIAFTKL